MVRVLPTAQGVEKTGIRRVETKTEQRPRRPYPSSRWLVTKRERTERSDQVQSSENTSAASFALIIKLCRRRSGWCVILCALESACLLSGLFRQSSSISMAFSIAFRAPFVGPSRWTFVASVLTSTIGIRHTPQTRVTGIRVLWERRIIISVNSTTNRSRWGGCASQCGMRVIRKMPRDPSQPAPFPCFRSGIQISSTRKCHGHGSRFRLRNSTENVCFVFVAVPVFEINDGFRPANAPYRLLGYLLGANELCATSPSSAPHQPRNMDNYPKRHKPRPPTLSDRLWPSPDAKSPWMWQTYFICPRRPSPPKVHVDNPSQQE